MRSVIPTTPMTVRDRQEALRERYVRAPELAWTTNLAWTEPSPDVLADPFRGAVHVGLGGPELPFAVDGALGGPHDDVVPGELLCAALAACVDSTIRILAARAGVRIERLAVIATGDLDARGALGAEDAPAALQSMRLEIELRVAPFTPAATTARLLAMAERRSVVLQTLKAALPVEVVSEVD